MTEFLRILRLGVPVYHACTAVGLTPETVRTWLHKAKNVPTCAQSFRDFAAAVSEAISGGVVKHVNDLVEMQSDKVRAASIRWLLSRRFPTEFGDPGKRETEPMEEARRQLESELAGELLRKARADARLAEAKAAVAEAVANDEEGRGWLVVGMAALMDHPDMPASLRAQLDEWFRRANVVEFRRKQLAGPDVETEATEG